MDTPAMDFVNDKNPVPLYETMESIVVPAFVKESAVIEPQDVANLGAVAFGDGAAREYPLHSPAAVWLSAAYHGGSNDHRTAVRNRIKAAAEMYDISSDVDQVFTHWDAVNAAQVKQASAPEPLYALTIEVEGKQEPYFDISNEPQVLKSARDIYENFCTGRLPVEYFYSASEELLKQAAVLGVPQDEIPEPIREAGDPRALDFDSALARVELRKRAGVTEDGMEIYRDLVKAAAAAPDQADAYIDLMVRMDLDSGVQYSRAQPDPVRLLRSGVRESEIRKEASLCVFVLEDAPVPLSVIQTCPVDLVEQSFSKQAAERILKAREASTSEAAERHLSPLTHDERLSYLQLLVNAA